MVEQVQLLQEVRGRISILSLARILTVVTYAYQNWARSAENKFVIHNENVEIKEMVETFWHPEREWAIYSSRMPSNVIWNRRWRWCTYLTRMAMPKRLMKKMKNVNSKKYEKEMIAMMMKTFVLLGKDDARNFRCIKCEQRNHWTVLTSRFGHMEWVHK